VNVKIDLGKQMME